LNWQKLQDKIKKKLDGIGLTLTLNTIMYGDYQIADGTKSEFKEEYVVHAIITDFSEEDIRGGLAQVGDKKILLNAKDVPDLEQYDSLSLEVTIAGTTLVLNPVDIDSVNPSGVNLLYKIHARG